MTETAQSVTTFLGMVAVGATCLESCVLFVCLFYLVFCKGLYLRHLKLPPYCFADISLPEYFSGG